MTPTHHPTDRYVFLCPSNSRPGLVHQVDIEANGFIGACNCEAFTIGKKGQPSKQTMAERGHWPASQCWCKHIRAARKQHCLNRAAEAFLEAVEEIKPRT